MLTIVIISFIFISGGLLAFSYMMSNMFHNYVHAERISFVAFFLAIVFLLLSIVHIALFASKGEDIVEILRSKGVPITGNKIYNVPIIRKYMVVEDGSDADFYILHQCRTVNKKGTGYDYTEADSIPIKDIQGFASSNVSDGTQKD